MSHGPAESALPASIAGWLPAFIGLALTWGSSFLFTRVAVRALPPLYLTLGEDIAALSVLLAVLVASRQRLPRDRRLWAHLAALAVPTSASQILAAYGVQRVSSALAAILFATAPLLAFLFAALVFRLDRLTPTRVVGAVLGFLGVLVVLGAWRGVGAGSLSGQLMCLAAAACDGFAFPYLWLFVTARHRAGLPVVAAGQLVATMQLVIVAPVAVRTLPAPTAWTPGVAGSMLALGIVCIGTGQILQFRVTRLAGALTAASVMYLVPLVATTLGVAVLGERLTWNQPAGAALIVAGLGVASRPHRARIPATPVYRADPGPSTVPPCRPVAAPR